MPSLKFSKVALNCPPLTVLAASQAGLWIGGQLFGRGSLWFSTDGQTFARKKAPDLYNWVLGGILPTADGELLVAGNYGILRSSNAAQDWPNEGFGRDVWALYRQSDGTIWAGGDHGVYRSSDDGVSWTEFGRPGSPVYCFVATDDGLLVLGKKPYRAIAGKLKPAGTCPSHVMAVAKSPDGTIVAVGKRGLVASSRDGSTWKTLRKPTKADLSAVAYCDDRFFIGGDDPDDFESGQDHALFELMDGQLKQLPYSGGRTNFNAFARFQGRSFMAVYDVSSGHPAYTGKGHLFCSGSVARSAKPDYKQFSRPLANETAEQALARYEKFVDAAKADPRLGNSAIWASDNKLTISRKPVSASDLAKAEQRLGTELPTSYKAFMTTKGLFSFGDQFESKLIPPRELARLDKSLAEEAECDLSDLDLSPDEIRYLGQTIPFSYGDAQLGIVKYYGFRVDGLTNGECPVVIFDEDQMGAEAVPLPKLRPFANSFDQHVSSIVTEKIKATEAYLEEGRYL